MQFIKLARGCLGVSRSQGACIYRCRTGFFFYPRSVLRHSQEVMVDRMGSGADCIALHGMIDEARKTLKRARNVSMNLDTQSFSGLECGTRRTLIQSSDSDSASASANTRLHAIIRCLGCSLSAGS